VEFPLGDTAGRSCYGTNGGNSVILKPSELTPLVGLKIEEVFKHAGLPSNVLQVITGDGATGAALVASGVDKIMFTGSVATGKRVAAAAAVNLTPVVLELGGKDPMSCSKMPISSPLRAPPSGVRFQTLARRVLP